MRDILNLAPCDDIIFKTSEIERQWNTLKAKDIGRQKLHKHYIYCLNHVSIVLTGEPLVITCYWRPLMPGEFLHPWLYATDFRIRDRTVKFYNMMVGVGKAMEQYDKRFRMNPHPELFGKTGQHIHCEQRAK